MKEQHPKLIEASKKWISSVALRLLKAGCNQSSSEDMKMWLKKNKELLALVTDQAKLDKASTARKE